MTVLNTANLSGQRTSRGRNMSTSSGLPFWPESPLAEEIRIEDIAAHLSRLCRFNGALRADVEIYSVAQHSCLVSDNVPVGYKLEGLLHDAAEAYLGDCIKPLKMAMPEREKWESRLELVVRNKFGLCRHKSPQVREADYRAVLTERRDLLPVNLSVDWGHAEAEPWPERILPWGVFRARREFLKRFEELTNGDY